MNVTKFVGTTTAFLGSALALLFLLLMGLLYVLHGGDGGGKPLVDAKEDAVLGSWHGSGGVEIVFKTHADFTAVNWPTSAADGWTGAAYSGKWTVESQADFPDAVMLHFYPEVEEERFVPGAVVMVKNGDGSLGLCPQDDPDSPCGLGVLKKSSRAAEAERPGHFYRERIGVTVNRVSGP